METINKLLALLPFTLRVEFAVYCARDVIINLNAVTKDPAIAAIELTEKWLKNPLSVTSSQLECAAYSAYSAAAASAAATSAANSAAYSANSAAYSAAATSAANSAAYSANSAAYSAASAAATSAAATSAANSAAKEKKLKQYEAHLKEMIKKLSKLEKEIYNLP